MAEITIYIGAAHRGFARKEHIKTWLVRNGYHVVDCGASVYDADDDYPDYAQAVARRVAIDTNARGIVICGSGVGVCIAANKIDGIRAGLALSPAHVRDATQHDHLNMLCLSADYMTDDEANACVRAFLETCYSQEERHVRRVKKITKTHKT